MGGPIINSIDINKVKVNYITSRDNNLNIESNIINDTIYNINYIDNKSNIYSINDTIYNTYNDNSYNLNIISQMKFKWQCELGHIFIQRPNNIRRNTHTHSTRSCTWCPTCTKNGMKFVWNMKNT